MPVEAIIGIRESGYFAAAVRAIVVHHIAVVPRIRAAVRRARLVEHGHRAIGAAVPTRIGPGHQLCRGVLRQGGVIDPIDPVIRFRSCKGANAVDGSVNVPIPHPILWPRGTETEVVRVV